MARYPVRQFSQGVLEGHPSGMPAARSGRSSQVALSTAANALAPEEPPEIRQSGPPLGLTKWQLLPGMSSRKVSPGRAESLQELERCAHHWTIL